MKARLKLISPERTARARGHILEIRGLGKIFHTGGFFTEVLKDMSFSVARGELICILGRSGCGKSTLLKIVAGFLSPSSGTVSVNGKSVQRPGPDRCVVFQEDALFPWLTVEENIDFGLKKEIREKRARRKEVDRFLSWVGLSEFRHYLPREISGGMKQRVALARVLILKPRVLLMDEPFAALDAQTREEMQNLLLSLWERLSHTVLFVTHDVNEAVTLADRILLMEKNPGRLKKEIPVDLPRPRKRDHDDFLALTRRLYGDLRE